MSKSGTRPRSPSHLSRSSRDFWLHIERTYELDDHHRELLTLACECLDRIEQARQLIKAEGLTIDDRFEQKKPHPALAIERQNKIAFARLIREIGLDEGPPDPRPPRRGGRQ